MSDSSERPSRSVCESDVCGCHPQTFLRTTSFLSTRFLDESDASTTEDILSEDWTMDEMRRLQQWMLGVCIVDFDLIHGQKLKLVYPCDVLSKREKKSISSLAFPDSHGHSGDDATSAIDSTFVFRFRADRNLTEVAQPDQDEMDDEDDEDDLDYEEDDNSEEDLDRVDDTDIVGSHIEEDQQSHPPPILSDSAHHITEDSSIIATSYRDWCQQLRKQRRDRMRLARTSDRSKRRRYGITASESVSSAMSDDGFLFGFAHFRRRKDSSLDRGYFQQSVVIVTRLPLLSVFEESVSIIAEHYFNHGFPVLKLLCRDIIHGWPRLNPENSTRNSLSRSTRAHKSSALSGLATSPHAGLSALNSDVRLPLLGSVVSARVRTDWLVSEQDSHPSQERSKSSASSSSSSSTKTDRSGIDSTLSSSSISSQSRVGPPKRPAPKAPTIGGPIGHFPSMTAAEIAKSKKNGIGGSGSSSSSSSSAAVSMLSHASVCSSGGVFQEVNIFKYFHSCLHHLWLLWELVLCGYPILVEANSVEECSNVVLCLVSLIAPLTCYGDYRPYFTIYDPDFKHFVDLHDSGLLDPSTVGSSSTSGLSGASVSLSSSVSTDSSGAKGTVPSAMGASSGSARGIDALRRLALGGGGKLQKLLNRGRQHSIILGVTNPLFRERTLSKFPNVLIFKDRGQPPLELAATKSAPRLDSDYLRTESTSSLIDMEDGWAAVPNSPSMSAVPLHGKSKSIPSSSLSTSADTSSAVTRSRRKKVKLISCIKGAMQPDKTLLSQLLPIPPEFLMDADPSAVVSGVSAAGSSSSSSSSSSSAGIGGSSTLSAADAAATLQEIFAINNLKIREYFVNLTIKVLTPLDRFCKVRVPSVAAKSIEQLMKPQSKQRTMKDRVHKHGGIAQSEAHSHHHSHHHSSGHSHISGSSLSSSKKGGMASSSDASSVSSSSASALTTESTVVIGRDLDEWNPYMNPPILSDLIGDPKQLEKFIDQIRANKRYLLNEIFNKGELRVNPVTSSTGIDLLIQLYVSFIRSNNFVMYYLPFYEKAKIWYRIIIERRIKTMCFACLIERKPIAEGRLMYGKIRVMLQRMMDKYQSVDFAYLSRRLVMIMNNNEDDHSHSHSKNEHSSGGKSVTMMINSLLTDEVMSLLSHGVDRKQVMREMKSDRSLIKSLIQHLRILEKCGVRPAHVSSDGAGKSTQMWSAHDWYVRLLKSSDSTTMKSSSHRSGAAASSSKAKRLRKAHTSSSSVKKAGKSADMKKVRYKTMSEAPS